VRRKFITEEDKTRHRGWAEKIPPIHPIAIAPLHLREEKRVSTLETFLYSI